MGFTTTPRPKTEREKYLTEPEFVKLLLAASRHEKTFYLIFAAGVLGLRVGEAVALNRDCFRALSRNMVDVPTLKRKGHPILPVFIDDETRAVFQEYLSEKMVLKQHWLFESQNHPGKHVTTEWAERLFNQALVRAGLNPAYTFHSLRHFRGLRLWKATKDLKFVQSQLRHKSMRTSEVYVHMDERDRAKLAKAIPPIGKESADAGGAV